MSNSEIHRAALRLRWAVEESFPTLSALDAFLRYFFPNIHGQLSSGMDWTARLNLLFTSESLEIIGEALLANFSPDRSWPLQKPLTDKGWGSGPGLGISNDRLALIEYLRKRKGPSVVPTAGEADPEAVVVPPPDTGPPLLFLEYDDEDRSLVDELLRQLRPLENQAIFRTFHRGLIRPGEEWQKETAARLGQAMVIVAIISSDLLASERFAPFAREAQRLARQGRSVIPLLARPAIWEKTQLGHLEPLPADRRFLSARSRSERDLALVEIAQALAFATQPPTSGASTPESPTKSIRPNQPVAVNAHRTTSAAAVSVGTATEPLRPRLALPTSYVLHLSDLHFKSARQVTPWIDLLEADLDQIKDEVPRLDAVVVSGDLTQVADRAEFAAAEDFLRELRSTYGLGPQQVILVPGNHDGSWTASQAAYPSDLSGALALTHSSERQLLHSLNPPPIPEPNEALYTRRFEAFANFYQAVCGQPYPLDFHRQATLHPFPAQKLLFVGLNSASQCDHLPKHQGRATMDTEAISPALRTIRREPTYADWLKIAVWHHPVQSDGEDRLKNTGFLDRLAQAGFRLGMHGHLHSAQLSQHAYDVVAEGRRIRLLGAGTFGAPTKEWRSGVPLQYQILRIEGAHVKVLSRCRDNPDGPWRGDGRWVVGAEARTYYEIDL